MCRKIYYIVIITLLVYAKLQSQEFQKAFTAFNVSNDFSRDQEGNIYTGGFTSFNFDPALDDIVSLDIINKLDNNGTVLWSRNFEVEGALTEILKVLTIPNGDLIALFSIDRIGEDLQLGLIRVSQDGNRVWSQTTEINIANFDEFSTQVNLIPADGNNFFMQTKKINTSDQIHFLTKFNGSGDILWSRSYATNLSINNSAILPLDENQLALVGHYTADVNATKGMIALLDAQTGELNSATSFDNIEVQSIVADGAGYIVKFKIAFNARAGIMRLDNNLDITWAKALDFEVEGQIGNFQKFNDDVVVMYIYDNRNRIELLTSYDTEGNQLWGKFLESKYSGRPFTEKVADSNGNILIMSHIWSTALRSSIFRQIPLDGNTEECILPNSCVEDEDFTTTKTSISFSEASPEPELNPIEVRLRTAMTNTSDFCEEVDGVPSALFEMDSTACINEEVAIFDINNDNADNISWVIEGGPEGAILPLASINNGLPISFQDSGLYTVTQFIEFQNCTSSFSQDVKVTEALPFEFAEDTLILCLDEIETVNVNRPGFVSYLWLDDNSPDPIKKIDTPGIYSVELNDGNCTKGYDLVVEDFDYGGVEFSLGPDTTVCEFRRYTLAADNVVNGVEYLWNDGVNTAERFASKEGLFTLTAFLDGCDFSDDINVTFEPCEPQVYMPNIFTPNADGFNDTLFPQGKNFELLSFRVYNRWGALLHDDISPWDGIFKNETVEGMYVYNISFLNERSGDIERMAGDVYLSQ